MPDTWLLWNPTAISTGNRIRKTGGVQKLYLTAKAEELLPRIREVFQEWNQILYDGFSDEEILLLSSMLRRLYSNAELALGHPEHLTERCPASEQAAPAASRKETGT